MSLLGEISRGVYGAWRLARRDPDGLKWFDVSAHGFWRSFTAAVLVLPAVLLLEGLDGSLARDEGLGRAVTVELIAYVIQWTAFPVVMSNVADSLGRGQHYIRFIVAYNWSQIVQMALFVPIAVVASVFPNPATALSSLMVMVLLLVYQTYVAHRALDVPPGMAIGIVILDMLLGGVVSKAASYLAA